MKTEDKINNLFIKLIKETNPEYALGVLESMKMAYYIICNKKILEGLKKWK
jgi:hypothetical protein